MSSSNPIHGYMSGEEYNSKRHMHPNVHSSTIYNSQDTETTQMFTDRLLDNEGVVYYINMYIYIYINTHIYPRTHTHNGILLTHKR